jgi:1,6-anhydro-N-acetylmuramate kinase
MTTRLAAGCMTGTSIDGIDASLVAIDGQGLEMKASVVRTQSGSLEPVREDLKRLARREPMTAGRIASLAREFSQLCADVVADVVQNDSVTLVAVHGQTVFHAPPLSWQLLAPAVIVRSLGAPLVFDLRAADLAAGGEGAPITPIADLIVFGHASESRAVVNLGGFVNVTRLPAVGSDPRDAVAGIRGGDVCVCNHLLDEIARRCFDLSFDLEGGRAALGAIDPEIYDDLLARLGRQYASNRSLGDGDELMDRAAHWSKKKDGADLARSAAAAIAETVCSGVGSTDRILVAGGGAKNRTLLQELSQRAVAPLDTSDRHGVWGDYREATAMAVLGALSLDRTPITLPKITGVPEPAPVAGCWCYP